MANFDKISVIVSGSDDSKKEGHLLFQRCPLLRLAGRRPKVGRRLALSRSVDDCGDVVSLIVHWFFNCWSNQSSKRNDSGC